MNWTELSQRKNSVQMAKRHTKKCSTSLTIKKIQIKTTLRFYFILVRIATIINTTKNKCWGCGKKEPLHTADQNVS
jgi:hypothetical protein